MAQFPFDPMNPYPTGYVPLRRSAGVSGDWGDVGPVASVPSVGGGSPFSALAGPTPELGSGGAFAGLTMPMKKQALQAQRARNPTLTTTASTAPAAPDSTGGVAPGVPGITAFNAQYAAMPGGSAGAGQQTPVAGPQTNMFGLTPEQMAERMQRSDALNRYQMGLSGMGLDQSAAEATEQFGQGFRPGIGGRGTAGRINSALSGGAEGYSSGLAMKQRREMAEMVKQLRGEYALGATNRADGPAPVTDAMPAPMQPETRTADVEMMPTSAAPDSDAAAALQAALDEEEKKRLEELMAQQSGGYANP